jgi:hypothetical protein
MMEGEVKQLEEDVEGIDPLYFFPLSQYNCMYVFAK